MCAEIMYKVCFFRFTFFDGHPESTVPMHYAHNIINICKRINQFGADERRLRISSAREHDNR